MSTESLPSRAAKLAADHPEIWSHYEALGKACAKAGPLDEHTVRLVKLAIAVGIGSEGAVHSHVRRGLEAGVAPEAMRQVAVLATTTMGFPKAIAALSWIEDILGKA